MRFQSGVVDQFIYFVAVDSTDLKTRETGLTSFTVYRSRNGAAAAAFTTPTINETDSTNMPGVYELLLDEDMTIDAGDDSQAVVLHITQASMAPVTLTYELYRPIITAGATITVANSCVDADIERIQGTAVATPATAGILDVNVKNIDNDAASASGTVTFPNATLASTVNITAGTLTTVTTATNVTTVNGLAANVITAASMAADASAEIADAVWDEDATGHQTQGTFGQAIGDPVADTNTIYKAVVSDATGATVGVDVVAIKAETVTILADTNELQTDWVNGGRLDNILDARASQTSLDTLDDFVDTEVGAIKTKTDQLTFTTANRVDSQVFGIQNAAITAASIATDAIDADAIAADAVTEIQSGLATAAALATVDTVVDSILVDTAEIGVAGAGLTALASQASVNTIDDFLDTEIAAITTTLGTPAGASISADIAAIEAQTDDIGVAGAGLTNVPWNAAWDAEVQSEVTDALVAYDPPTHAELVSEIDAVQADIAALTIPTAAGIADAVWDEAIAGHLGAGSTGLALNSAGAAGDPWSTALPGAYGAGTAGKIVGDNINATISSRGSQTSVDDLPTNAELATALGTADDATLAAIAALSIPTANQNADALLDRAAGVETGRTLRQALRLMLAAVAGKLSGAATTSIVIRDSNDSVNRITATVDADGNRSAITYDVS